MHLPSLHSGLHVVQAGGGPEGCTFSHCVWIRYLGGRGVERSISRWFTMLGWAAALGSEEA